MNTARTTDFAAAPGLATAAASLPAISLPTVSLPTVAVPAIEMPALPRRRALGKTLRHRAGLLYTLTLLGTSAAYCVYALGHMMP